MRFSKKINIAKENRKLGSDFMSSGSIRALNTNEVQSGEKKNESDDADLFKKVENFKVGNSREPDQGNKAEFKGSKVKENRNDGFAAQEENSNRTRRFSKWMKFHANVKNWLDHRRLTRWIALCFIALTVWSIIYSIAGSAFLPDSQLFKLLVLFIVAYVGGEIVKVVQLPSLLGMLLAGLLLRNIGFAKLEGVYIEIGSNLRQMALCVILIRAGLGLDPKALRNLKFVILRLAFLPGLVEGTIMTIVSHFLLGIPWVWGILLGAILAAVSPAVVIPCLFKLQEQNYGTQKGITTLVVAAATLDDIFAITVFGVILNIIYSTGSNLMMQIIQGPLGILIGILFGIIWGYVCHFVPHQKDKQAVLLRVLMMIGGGLMAIVGSGSIGYQGAGPLGCIVAAFTASLGWKMEGQTEENRSVASVFKVIWIVFQPILFSLIGTEVDVSVIEMSTLGLGLIALFSSLLARIVVSTFVSYGVNFNWKEKIFISWAWFPKATVQAALGPLALDAARKRGLEEDMAYGRKILLMAVLAILSTAPIGAVLISILGPKLLTKNQSQGNAGKRSSDISLNENNSKNYIHSS